MPRGCNFKVPKTLKYLKHEIRCMQVLIVSICRMKKGGFMFKDIKTQVETKALEITHGKKKDAEMLVDCAKKRAKSIRKKERKKFQKEGRR